MSYDLTKSRIWQWLGIILIVGLFAGAYWYFEVRAGYKTNVLSPTGSLTSGLIGYWPFDSVSVIGTTALDRSTNKYNGLISGGAVVTSGRVSQAVNFDGTDDSMALGSTGYLNVNATADMTISGWFSRDTFTTDDVIVSKINGIGPGEIGYGVYISSGDQLIFKIGDGVQTYTVTTSMTFTTSVWTHFSIVWDQDSAVNTKIYVDGQSVSTSTSGTISDIDDTSHTNTFRIGALSSGGELFDGKLDEIRVYNRTLTASEVLTLYNFDGTGVELNSGASQAQGGSRLDSGLAGYWKLDDGSGTSATDASTNGNTGTLTNGPTWTTGQIGGAVNFDGTDDYISIPDAANNRGSRPMTAVAWVKRDAVGEGDAIFMKRGGTNDGWGLIIGSDNKLAMSFYGIADRYSVSTITDTAWHHIVATVDGSGNLMFYIDGSSAGSTGNFSSSPTTTTQPLRLGVSTTSDGTINGYQDFSLDEARIYNRALSSDEVAELYRLNTPSGTDTSLDGYWSFNGKDISGTTAYDRSGSGNNGTLTNGPTITPGKVGQALEFDGTNDSVVLNTSTVLKPALFTVSTWAYADTGSVSYRGIYLPSYADGYNSGFLLYINNDGYAAVRYGNGSAPVGNITSGESVLGGWHYLVTTFDGTTLALFVDGVEKASITASTLAYAGGSTTAQIGAGNGTDTFDGKLDEFRLYGRAFTEAEIVSQYTAGRSDELNSGASQAQGGSRLDSGLAGYWKLDDGSGTSATDSSTNGNTGTLTNGPTWTTGQIGGAVSFDGTDDVITTSTVVPSMGTVSAWVNTTAVLNSGDYYMFVGGSVGGSSMSLRFNSYSGFNRWDFNMRGNFGTDVYVSGPTLTTDTQQGWHHLTAVWDTSKGASLYLDGALLNSTTTTTGAFASMALSIGMPSFSWLGKIDEVRMYNRQLSADEVAQLYRLTTPTGTDTSLKGYWSFNGKDVSGTTAYDRSGSGNNGTLTNGPTVTPGKVGQALSFDGTNDYIDAGPANVLDNLTTYTVTAWIKPETVTGVDNIATKGGATWLSGWVFRACHNDANNCNGISNTLTFGVYFSTAVGRWHTNANSLNLNQWNFVAVTYDRSLTSNDPILYINGTAASVTEVSAPSGTYVSDASNNLVIGSSSTAGDFDGSLDEVRLYNRALSATEIASLYNASQ